MLRFKKPKIGLALGGGGPKGLAHIGVIKILEKNDVSIDFIAGTSIGALVGGMYAAIRDIKKIEEIALNTNWREALPLIDPSIFRGFIGGEKLLKFIENLIGKATFDDLKIPFSAVATDLDSGDPMYINEGEVSKAIRASLSLPLVFKPVMHNERWVADGGLSEPVPVKALNKMGAEIIIAVNILAHYSSENKKPPSGLGFYSIASDSISILNHHLAQNDIKDADIIVQPKVSHVGWKSFFTREGSKKVITIGEEAMSEKLDELKKRHSKKFLWYR